MTPSVCTKAGGVFYRTSCEKIHKLNVLDDHQNHVIKSASGKFYVKFLQKQVTSVMLLTP